METNTEISSHEWLTEALDRLRPAMQEKEVELSVSENLPEVLGNKVRLREAFYNLLSNAVKFIDKRPGRISVAAEVQGNECVFCISDNGSGIPAEELERIFVPFCRLSMHHDVPGSGLGLYFTKNMIEHQAGRIWVDKSQPGKGSRFYVLLKRSPTS